MKRTRAFSPWGMFLRNRNRQSSGTSVSDRSREPASALVTVQAIGASIDPEMQLLFGHVAFVATLLARPNGLLAGKSG